MPQVTATEILTDPALRFVYSLTAEDLCLLDGTVRTLTRAGLPQVRKIAQKSETAFFLMTNFGSKELTDLKVGFERIGVALDTHIVNDTEEFSAELDAVRDAREQSLPELERRAGLNRVEDNRSVTDRIAWLDAAKDLVTPAALNHIRNERHRGIVADRIRGKSFRQLGAEMGRTPQRMRELTAKGVLALRLNIRLNLLERQLAAVRQAATNSKA